LLLLYLGTLAAVLGMLAAAQADAAVPLRPAAWTAFAQIALFVVAFMLAYVISYSAIEASSPTLVMIRALESAGPAGLDAAAYHARLSDAVLVLPRLADLVRDGLLVREGDRYRITPKGRRFVGLFLAYRRLLGAGKGG
jgi:hypothetical protein